MKTKKIGTTVYEYRGLFGWNKLVKVIIFIGPFLGLSEEVWRTVNL